MNLRWKVAQFVELLWWKNYVRLKPKDEYLKWKKEYWQQLLNKAADVFQLNETNTAIDFGCGPAGVFILFDKNKITALDPLIEQYETSIPIFSKAEYPNVSFRAIPMEAFNESEQYDVAFCMNAINHVADIAQGYDVLVNAVKPSGTILITIDAHNYSFFKYLFKLLPGDVLHPHQYDLMEYAQFLEERNCTILKTVLVKKEFFFNHYLLVAKKN